MKSWVLPAAAVVFLLLVVLAVSGCTAELPEPTPAPAAESTSTTAPEPTPAPEPKILTSTGTVVITKVGIVDEDPAGNKAAPGYQILLIWFEDENGGAESNFYEASEDVYITGDDGSKTERYFGESYLGGSNLEKNRYTLGFTPPITAQEFSLDWPDNPPVKLVLGSVLSE